jgi:hypothetical protein
MFALFLKLKTSCTIKRPLPLVLAAILLLWGSPLALAMRLFLNVTGIQSSRTHFFRDFAHPTYF